jgi:hypothetical protein
MRFEKLTKPREQRSIDDLCIPQRAKGFVIFTDLTG